MARIFISLVANEWSERSVIIWSLEYTTVRQLNSCELYLMDIPDSNQ
jgi:hypothetical protein